MGVLVELPVDHKWNGGSYLRAGVKIYHWRDPQFWLILSSQNDPLLEPTFHPPMWSIGGPISLRPQKARTQFIMCTQIKVLGAASYPVSHWPCPGRASHAWE